MTKPFQGERDVEERKSGDKFHPKPNRSSRPVANEYHESEKDEKDFGKSTCRAEIGVGLCEPCAWKRKLTAYASFRYG